MPGELPEATATYARGRRLRERQLLAARRARARQHMVHQVGGETLLGVRAEASVTPAAAGVQSMAQARSSGPRVRGGDDIDHPSLIAPPGRGSQVKATNAPGRRA